MKKKKTKKKTKQNRERFEDMALTFHAAIMIQKRLPVGLIPRGTGLSLQNADCRLQTVQTEILISRNTNVTKTGTIESKTEYFCFSFDFGFQSYGRLKIEI